MIENAICLCKTSWILELDRKRSGGQYERRFTCLFIGDSTYSRASVMIL